MERTLDRYKQTAVAIAHTDGPRGLALLDALDLEAVYLYEKHPNDFRRLRDALNDTAAAEVLLHWREYFGLKRADDVDRGRLIAEITRLSPSQRRAAAKHPAALPLLLAEPAGVTELIEHWSGDPNDLNDLLVLLDFISLEKGAADLRAALRAIEGNGALALEAFRLQGPDGFAIVALYGPILEALGGSMPTDQALIVLRVNSDYLDELLKTHRPETIAAHLAACGRGRRGRGRRWESPRFAAIGGARQEGRASSPRRRGRRRRCGVRRLRRSDAPQSGRRRPRRARRDGVGRTR